jgi:hypothetical protein
VRDRSGVARPLLAHGCWRVYVSWALNNEIDRDQNVRVRSPAAVPSSGELQSLFRVTLALFVIGLGVWLLLARTAYRRQYSGTGVAWHRGANNFIEITLVREDNVNLACASDASIQGLTCGFRADRRPRQAIPATFAEASTFAGDDGTDDAHLLRPYNTVNGELFLGAGLWESLPRHGRLPDGRFTVNCDLEIVGALHSVALRWTRNGRFEANDRNLAAGVLRNCFIPP